MAVKDKEELKKLILEIDNGDLSKLKDVMEKWHFKDYQSFWRFAISVLFLSEDNSIAIKMEGKEQKLAPADDLIKKK